MLKKQFFTLFFLLYYFCLSYCQTNPNHFHVRGYTRRDGTYVQPYFRTAPNSTNRDNFSTYGNTNPYTGKAGWIEPDSKYNTLYYDTYTFNSTSVQNEYTRNSTLPIKYKNRTYIEDEYGGYTCYLKVKDKRTYFIYNLNDEIISYLVINHRGDWRVFDSNWIYLKTIFVTTEK